MVLNQEGQDALNLIRDNLLIKRQTINSIHKYLLVLCLRTVYNCKKVK